MLIQVLFKKYELSLVSRWVDVPVSVKNEVVQKLYDMYGEGFSVSDRNLLSSSSCVMKSSRRTIWMPVSSKPLLLLYALNRSKIGVLEAPNPEEILLRGSQHDTQLCNDVWRTDSSWSIEFLRMFKSISSALLETCLQQVCSFLLYRFHSTTYQQRKDGRLWCDLDALHW